MRAGAADVRRVADRLEQPLVDRVVARERVDTLASDVDGYALEHGAERVSVEQLEPSLHRITHPEPISRVVEHVLVDDRVNVRVVRDEDEPATGGLVVRPANSRPGSPTAAATGSAPRADRGVRLCIGEVGG